MNTKKNIYTLVVIIVAVIIIVALSSMGTDDMPAPLNTNTQEHMEDNSTAEKTTEAQNTPTRTSSTPVVHTTNTNSVPATGSEPFNPFYIDFVYGYDAQYPDRSYVNFQVIAKQHDGTVADDVDGYNITAQLFNDSGYVADATSAYDRVTQSWKAYFAEALRTGNYTVNIKLACRETNSVKKLTCAQEYGTDHFDSQSINLTVN